MLVRVGLGEPGLQVTDDCAELTCIEEPGPKRTRGVLTNGREDSQGGPDPCRHVAELPADLVFDGLRPVRVARPTALTAYAAAPRAWAPWRRVTILP